MVRPGRTLIDTNSKAPPGDGASPNFDLVFADGRRWAHRQATSLTTRRHL